MARYMADACNPANLPAGDLGAVYVDGICATAQTAGRRTISSVAAADAHEGDVEPGNPTWPTWVQWVVRQRNHGNPWPWLYCCDDGYGGSFFDGWRHADGVAAFARAGVPEPLWRVFNFNRSAPPAYAVAVQVAVGLPPGYDWNILQDAPIPGLDPVPAPHRLGMEDHMGNLFGTDDKITPGKAGCALEAFVGPMSDSPTGWVTTWMTLLNLNEDNASATVTAQLVAISNTGAELCPVQNISLPPQGFYVRDLRSLIGSYKGGFAIAVNNVQGGQLRASAHLQAA